MITAVQLVNYIVPIEIHFSKNNNLNRENINMEAKDGSYFIFDVPQRTEIEKEKPPYDLKIRWGWTESIISRNTAELILHNKQIQHLRDWVQDIFFPEEFFYATLATLDKNKLRMGKVDQGICIIYDYTAFELGIIKIIKLKWCIKIL